MNANEISIRVVNGERDRDWLARLWDERWGGQEMASRGRIHHVRDLPAMIAASHGREVGAVTYFIEGGECEITSLDALEPRIGIGSALMSRVEQIAADAGCSRVWMITTNDNLDALRFYQRRRYRIVAVHPGAIDQARASTKPTIPEFGFYGIPIRDEIELEKNLSEFDE